MGPASRKEVQDEVDPTDEILLQYLLKKKKKKGECID